ncbi:MAG: hypothetical protein KDB26_13990 [Microthrixaceae bacterium]|nr:hypothetical protein [Microthrixaceae bacterium]
MDDIIDAIDAALDEVDDFPWNDAARWSPTPSEDIAAGTDDPPWLVPIEPLEYDNPDVGSARSQPPGCDIPDPAPGQLIILRAELSDMRECRYVYAAGDDPMSGTWSGDERMIDAAHVLMRLDPQRDKLHGIASAIAALAWHGHVSDAVWLALHTD